MDPNAYPTLANIHLPAHSRLLRHSCCPDKDVVLVFSRLGGLERISLYHTHQGTKIWETDVGEESSEKSTEALDVSWSPDGRSIALLLEPPRIALLSIQDGHTIYTLPLAAQPRSSSSDPSVLSEISWFRAENREKKPSAIPDMFRRQNIITGSTESILKTFPRLDPLQEEAKLSTTNLFAFQGTQAKSQSKTKLPESISLWPTLSADSKAPVVDSSIQTKVTSKPEEPLDETDEANVDSVLVVSDKLGNIYCFLDGTFPLGTICLGGQTSFASAEKSNSAPLFFGHYKSYSGKLSSTHIEPTLLDMPLLVNRKMRDLARLSSIARDLAWYGIRVIKEMKDAWCGPENGVGARHLGPRWLETLKTKQTDFGQKNGDPIYDLTYLLTTGRATKPLEDFLGGGEQMSERSIQKWESVMSDALMKLRDYSEKRLVPCCQRLQLLLVELQGWTELPLQYGIFDLNPSMFEEAFAYTEHNIFMGSILASTARQELFRFKEFMAWLRFEVANAHAPTEATPPRHDILEVNHYLKSGLASSPIDKWFFGEGPPSKAPEPLVKRSEEAKKESLGKMLNQARLITTNPTLPLACIFALSRGEATLTAVHQQNIPHVEPLSKVKNIAAGSDALAEACHRVFIHAATAATRLRNIDIRGPTISLAESDPRWELEFRERIEQNEDGITNLILAPIKNDDKSAVLLRIRHSGTTPPLSIEISFAVVQCHAAEGADRCEILATDFFDEQSIIVVYRAQNNHAYLSSFRYDDLNFTQVPYDSATSELRTWEDLAQGALTEVNEGRIAVEEVIFTRHRVLGGRGGEVSLAVNGRSQRRVVCVLDSTGTRLDTFDLAEEEEDE